MAQKLGSPSLSRLGVSRDLEIENNATITGLGLGLVAEMNLVELGLVAEILVEHGTGGGYMIEARVSRSFDEMITIDLVETTLTIRLQTCTTLRLSNR